MAAIGTIKDLFANCRTFEKTKLTEKIQLALDSPNAQAAEFASELAVVKGLIGMFVQETKNGTPPLPKKHIRQDFGLCSHYESNCRQIESSVKLLYRVPKTQGDYAVQPTSVSTCPAMYIFLRQNFLPTGGHFPESMPI